MILPARIDSEDAAIGRPTQTARRLVEASVRANTRRAYADALRRLDAWLDGRELHDVDSTDGDGILVTVRRSKTRTRRAR